MHRLNAALNRLYAADPAADPTAESAAQLTLISAEGRTRAMLIDFRKSTDWESLAALYQALQEDLDLPAPAISVAGDGGYRLWLTLAETRPLAEVQCFLQALQRRYLAELSASHLVFQPPLGPTPAGLPPLEVVPGLHPLSGKWSAFIDPSMGAMFIDESGLEMAPNAARQADMLGSLKSISNPEFDLALKTLNDQEMTARTVTAKACSESPLPASNLGQDYRDPQSFLLAVLNDPAAKLSDRIEAAKALLPYFARPLVE